MRVFKAAVMLCLSIVPALAQREPWPTGWAVAGEIGGCAVFGTAGGLVGTAVGIGGLWLMGGSMNDEDAIVASLCIGAASIGYPLGCAVGTWAAGAIGRQRGAFWGSAVGAVVGAVPPLLALMVVSRGDDLAGHISAPLVFAAAALPPTGAILGYNLTRPRNTEVGWLEQHVDMPRVAMTVTHDEFMHPVAGVRCDLLSARF